MYQIFSFSDLHGIGSSPVSSVKHGRNLLRSLRRAVYRTGDCCAAVMSTPFGTYYLAMAHDDPNAAFAISASSLSWFSDNRGDSVPYVAHLRARGWRAGLAFVGEYITGTSCHLAQLFPFRVSRGLY